MRHDCHFGEEFPQTPLSRRSLVRRRIAAACNARRNSYRGLLDFNLKSAIAQTRVLSNGNFYPAKLYKQIYFKLKKGCCKTSSFATAFLEFTVLRFSCGLVKRFDKRIEDILYNTAAVALYLTLDFHTRNQAEIFFHIVQFT